MKSTGDVFSYRDYKHYLEAVLAPKDQGGRGTKSELAKFVQCQPAYISQVLNANAQLSPEQAEACTRFLGHTKSEAHFFQLLVMHNRASTRHLKSYYQDQLEQEIEARDKERSKFGVRATLGLPDQARYYSSWHYAAVHVLTAIPGFQTLESIANKLKIEETAASEILAFLVASGILVEKHAGVDKSGPRKTASRKSVLYQLGQERIHLERDSPFVAQHHINWRLRSSETAHHPKPEDLRYSSVVTFSEKDKGKIRAILLKAIEEAKAAVRDSGNETIACVSLDFFEL